MNEFHARVFGFNPPSQIIPSETSNQDGNVLSFAGQEEDDLGYYPDGNKRTLTDNQIAMFRHSEIYSIIRERQLRRENREDGSDDGSEITRSGAATASGGLIPFVVEKEVEHPAGIVEDEREPSIKHQRQDDLRAGSAITKRERNSAETGDRYGKAYTSRRLARELDSSVAQDCVLDYGDQPPAKYTSTHAHPEEASPDNNGNQQEDKAPAKGQKIWWPVIQAT